MELDSVNQWLGNERFIGETVGMKTLAAIRLLTATACGQEGLEEIGTGIFPPEIVGETDFKKVQLLRCEVPPNVELTERCWVPRWEVCRCRRSQCRN